jgi:hypothetical protein
VGLALECFMEESCMRSIYICIKPKDKTLNILERIYEIMLFLCGFVCLDLSLCGLYILSV